MARRNPLLALLAAVSLLGACASPMREVAPDPAFAPAPLPEPALGGAAADNGSIYVPGSVVALFEDRTALRVGDILTVVLSESTAASTSASTSTQKDDSLDLGAPTLLGRTYTGRNVLENAAENSRSFTGAGDSTQSNSLDGEITVTVARVLPNGNLLVRGEKIMSINQGAEYVRVTGLVRPQDVRPDNTVLSSRVANAQIHYGGGGVLAEANTKGWLSRFFSSAWWPF